MLDLGHPGYMQGTTWHTYLLMISDTTETVKEESPGVSLGEEGDSSKISTDVPDSTTKGRFTFYEL